MVRLVFFISMLIVGCGNPPCKDYCADACNKDMSCSVSFRGGEPLTEADIPTCVDSCYTASQAAHETDDQCNAAIQSVNGETCAQFIAALNTNGRR